MTTEEIIQGLTDFIGEIKENNNGELIILSLLPIRQTRPWSTHYSAISKEIPIVNEGLNQYCKDNEIRFIDAYSYFADKEGIMREDLSDDDVHPNRENGYDVLIKLINNELNKIQLLGNKNIKKR